MGNPDVQQRRKDMLYEPHVARLTALAGKLRERGLGEVPDFDPLDAGEAARALFLFEKPGPKTAEGGTGRRAGSGFISRNNDDPTAANIFNFMQRAGIPRKQTVIWNVIPWWNGTRKVTAQELRRVTASVNELITILKALRAVVMVGSQAAKVKPFLDPRLELFSSCHPSNVVRATNRNRWEEIPSEWAKLIPYIAIDR